MEGIIQIMGKIIIILVIIGVIIYLLIFGWHKETLNGERTGYITSVERTGLFFKTFKVYLKTDPQSSQENVYCVVDPKVYSQLEQLSEQKVQVTVSYFSWFISGIKNCGRESGVIFYTIPTQDIEQKESNAKAVIGAYEVNDSVKQNEIAYIKDAITKIQGREATFFEIEQVLTGSVTPVSVLTPSASSTSTTTLITYKVQDGDTLNKIVEEYGFLNYKTAGIISVPSGNLDYIMIGDIITFKQEVR